MPRTDVEFPRCTATETLLLFQLLTLPLMGYGLSEVTATSTYGLLEVVTVCPVLLPQALLVFLKLPLHGSYLFQMVISLSHLGIRQDLEDSEFALCSVLSVA